MAGGSIEDTLARIDAALARVEQAVERTESDRAEVTRRHARLRIAVSESLEELDTIIAGTRS